MKNNMSLRRDWLKNKGNDKFNKCTQFLLPMIYYNIDDFTGDYNNYLINCYITKEFDGKIIVICDNIEDEHFKIFLYKNELNPYYLNSLLDDNNKEIQLVYQIPNNYIEDYYTIIDSKYSFISKSYKDKLIKIYGRQCNTNNYKATMYDTLYPTEFKRKQIAQWLGYDVKSKDWMIINEVLDKFDLDKNLFQSIEDIKLHYQMVL